MIKKVYVYQKEEGFPIFELECFRNIENECCLFMQDRDADIIWTQVSLDTRHLKEFIKELQIILKEMREEE